MAAILSYFWPVDFLRDTLLYVSLVALTCMIIGLIRPWIMLWWEDVQNRKKVIRVYGTITLATFVIYRILLFIEQS